MQIGRTFDFIIFMDYSKYSVMMSSVVHKKMYLVKNRQLFVSCFYKRVFMVTH